MILTELINALNDALRTNPKNLKDADVIFKNDQYDEEYEIEDILTISTEEYSVSRDSVDSYKVKVVIICGRVY